MRDFIHANRYLNNVTIDYANFIDDPDSKKGERPPVRFDDDGNRQDVELKIVNLRDTTGGTDRVWEEVRQCRHSHSARFCSGGKDREYRVGR